MSRTDDMVNAYIEAIYFTETGDSEQPSADAELSALTRAEAYQACRNFLQAAGAHRTDEYSPSQLGHDLWLTRNGHGTGFWDRPEIYGTARAELFTMLAKAMGEHDAVFEEGDDEDEAIRETARDIFGGDDLTVDTDATVSRSESGAWVQAWVYVDAAR